MNAFEHAHPYDEPMTASRNAPPADGEERESEATTGGGPPGRRQRIGLVLGPALLFLMLFSPPPEGMEPAAWRAAAVGVLMAVWWVSEAIPIPATALVPLALFPILGVLGIEAAAAPYANSVIFLFLGGFLIAAAMQRWELHKRIALLVILAVGTQPIRLIGGFMIASGFLSMWVSNTATAVMMLPIGLSVIHLALPRGPDGRIAPEDSNFAVALMLGIAYACSIGGLGTLIGTPPNALLAGYMQEAYGVQIGFAEWMVLGVPLVLIGLPLSWFVLTRVAYPVRLKGIPGGADTIRLELRKLGGWTRGEQRVGIVFVTAAIAWIFRPVLEAWIPGLSDAGIAIGAAIVLFLLPVDWDRGIFVIEWDDARTLPWDVLVLFGGGLSLAAAISQTGLAAWIGAELAGLQALPTIGLILAVTLVVIFLTELTSNTATAAAFLPILGSLAVGIGENPLVLVVPAALAASCAFMMPVATPPNAIVYGSSFVTIPQMAKAGIYLNVLFTGLITGLGYALIVLAFGVEAGVLPEWAR
ncbi:MAG: DASS family sodium-coupled anion symporter [Gemmatimonadota bacterium]